MTVRVAPVHIQGTRASCPSRPTKRYSKACDVVRHVAVERREHLDSNEEDVHRHGIGDDQGQLLDRLLPRVELREAPG